MREKRGPLFWISAAVGWGIIAYGLRGLFHHHVDTRPANLYQVGCIYALTSKTNAEDKKEAFHLLWSAVKGGFGLDLLDTDSDLDPLRKDPQFATLVAYARAAAKRD